MRTKTAAAAAFTLAHRQDAREAAVERLRRGIAEAGLDRGCRKTANDMLDKVGIEEDFIRRAAGLADARKMRDAIRAVLSLLGELDEIMPDEPDRTAFQEIACLFRDVSDFASFGAEAAKRAAGGDC